MYEPDYDENGMLIWIERTPIGGLEPDWEDEGISENRQCLFYLENKRI